MSWKEIIKELNPNDSHGQAISEGYAEQLTDEYKDMIPELINDLQRIQKLKNSYQIRQAVMKFIEGPYDPDAGNLAELFHIYKS